MGRFEIVSSEGTRTYTVFAKSSYRNVLRLEADMPMYNFVGEGRYMVEEIYYDSPNNLLASAGILLSKVVEDGKAFFKVEREDYLYEKKLSKQKKIFVHPIGLKDGVQDHTIFLINGITSFFTTKFSIDLENILKVVVPKVEIRTKVDSFKILSGTGFKGVMTFEEVKIKNNFTKRKADVDMLKIELASSESTKKDFLTFIEKLEKYCKEIMPISDSKYQIALRMTK